MGAALPIVGALISIAGSFMGGQSQPSAPTPIPLPPPPPPAPTPVPPAIAPEQTTIEPGQAIDLEAAKARQIRRNALSNVTPVTLLGSGNADQNSGKDLTGG